MPVSTKAILPRIYLDIDGVVISDDPTFETVKLNAIESYSPEVVRRLGNTGMEIVLLSSWENDSIQLIEGIEAFKDGRILLPTRMGRETNWITRKRTALLGEQEHSPSPFVWVDDDMTDWAKRIISSTIEVPKLLIKPDKRTGLDEAELIRIEAFARITN